MGPATTGRAVLNDPKQPQTNGSNGETGNLSHLVHEILSPEIKVYIGNERGDQQTANNHLDIEPPIAVSN
jgi:hypothetical protein